MIGYNNTRVGHIVIFKETQSIVNLSKPPVRAPLIFNTHIVF